MPPTSSRKHFPFNARGFFLKVQSESDPIARHFRPFSPIIGLVVIEGRTGLDAVLEEVHKDSKEVMAK